MELRPNGTVTAVQYVTTGATMDRDSGDEKAVMVREAFRFTSFLSERAGCSTFSSECVTTSCVGNTMLTLFPKDRTGCVLSRDIQNDFCAGGPSM